MFPHREVRKTQLVPSFYQGELRIRQRKYTQPAPCPSWEHSSWHAATLLPFSQLTEPQPSHLQLRNSPFTSQEQIASHLQSCFPSMCILFNRSQVELSLSHCLLYLHSMENLIVLWNNTWGLGIWEEQYKSHKCLRRGLFQAVSGYLRKLFLKNGMLYHYWAFYMLQFSDCQLQVEW